MVGAIKVCYGPDVVWCLASETNQRRGDAMKELDFQNSLERNKSQLLKLDESK